MSDMSLEGMFEDACKSIEEQKHIRLTEIDRINFKAWFFAGASCILDVQSQDHRDILSGEIVDYLTRRIRP